MVLTKVEIITPLNVKKNVMKVSHQTYYHTK